MRAGCSFVHSLRQHRFNESFLQLLMDLLKLTECFLTGQKTIMNAYFHIIDLQIKQETIVNSQIHKQQMRVITIPQF